MNLSKFSIPWHGMKFDLKTGESLGPMPVDGVTAYSVVVEGDELKIEVA